MMEKERRKKEELERHEKELEALRQENVHRMRDAQIKEK